MIETLIVVNQSPVREFDSVEKGQSVKIKVVDVVLTDNINSFVASAFEKVAQRMQDTPLKAGALIKADLAFSVRTVKSEKGEFMSQNVRLNNFGIIVEP